jgi:hypothetical protein
MTDRDHQPQPAPPADGITPAEQVTGIQAGRPPTGPLRPVGAVPPGSVWPAVVLGLALVVLSTPGNEPLGALCRRVVLWLLGPPALAEVPLLPLAMVSNAVGFAAVCYPVCHATQGWPQERRRFAVVEFAAVWAFVAWILSLGANVLLGLVGVGP